MIKFPYLHLSCFFIMSCVECSTVTDVDQLSSAQISERFTRSYDQFSKATTIKGPEVIFNTSEPLYRYWLQADYHDSTPDKRQYSLILSTYRSPHRQWAFWERARDASGTVLRTRVVRRDVLRGGRTHEILQVYLTLEYLQGISKASSAMLIRIEGDNDRCILSLDPHEIVGFLLAANENSDSTQSM